MKPIKYKIARGVTENEINDMILVDGFEAFEMFGLKFGVREVVEPGQGTGGDFTCWEVTELGTGFRVDSKLPILSMYDAIAHAKFKLHTVGEAFVIDSINRARAILALSKPKENTL